MRETRTKTAHTRKHGHKNSNPNPTPPSRRPTNPHRDRRHRHYLAMQLVRFPAHTMAPQIFRNRCPHLRSMQIRNDRRHRHHNLHSPHPNHGLPRLRTMWQQQRTKPCQHPRTTPPPQHLCTVRKRNEHPQRPHRAPQIEPDNQKLAPKTVMSAHTSTHDPKNVHRTPTRCKQ